MVFLLPLFGCLFENKVKAPKKRTKIPRIIIPNISIFLKLNFIFFNQGS